MDKVSRHGSFKRMHSNSLDHLSNGRAHLWVSTDSDLTDLDNLDIDTDLIKSNASIVTMSFGNSKSLWTSWYKNAVQNGQTPYIIVPTAWDALGSFHKRDVTDSSQAMPDLDFLLQVLSVFDVTPMGGHIWSPTVPCWSLRHAPK